ncbi:hypothetical protein IW136_002307, partial [Coemansia sp. RSA 678]
MVVKYVDSFLKKVLYVNELSDFTNPLTMATMYCVVDGTNFNCEILETAPVKKARPSRPDDDKYKQDLANIDAEINKLRKEQ